MPLSDDEFAKLQRPLTPEQEAELPAPEELEARWERAKLEDPDNPPSHSLRQVLDAALARWGHRDAG